MNNTQQLFKKVIDEGYTFKKDSIILGTAMYDKQPLKNTLIKVPLKMLNRHGLIAGATGTGKTKSLQIIAEQLSLKGIPSILMDLKGDLSGLAKPGSNNKHITWRHGEIGIPYEPMGLPVELMTISNENAVKLRATVTEFGPVLFSKILDLNNTQSGIMAVVFKYCDDNQLPLIDMEDVKKTLRYLTNEGKKEIEGTYGSLSKTSVSTIMRKIIELEQQGATAFFGERSFNVEDLLRVDKNGYGIISIIRLTDIQDKPKLFSTFMLSLLAEVYATFPEKGDLDKPKLAMFIDEAHLIFNNATKQLIEQIEAIIKLIRSKAVGVYFCTQNPIDLPDTVLSQLGLKVQHALRAFTAKDRESIRKTAQNFPLTDFFKTDEVLTSMGIGEALITTLNEKGIPTPLATTLMRAPISRMNILNVQEIDEVVNKSLLVYKYNEEIDRVSAYEILTKKINKANTTEHRQKIDKQRRKSGKDGTIIETLSKNTMVRQLGRTLMREAVRGLLGVLGVR